MWGRGFDYGLGKDELVDLEGQDDDQYEEQEGDEEYDEQADPDFMKMMQKNMLAAKLEPRSKEEFEDRLLSGQYVRYDPRGFIAEQGNYMYGEESGDWIERDEDGDEKVFRYEQGQRIGAICMDGSQSGATGRGACSWHGGVKKWLHAKRKVFVRGTGKHDRNKTSVQQPKQQAVSLADFFKPQESLAKSPMDRILAGQPIQSSANSFFTTKNNPAENLSVLSNELSLLTIRPEPKLASKPFQQAKMPGPAVSTAPKGGSDFVLLESTGSLFKPIHPKQTPISPSPVQLAKPETQPQESQPALLPPKTNPGVLGLPIEAEAPKLNTKDSLKDLVREAFKEFIGEFARETAKEISKDIARDVIDSAKELAKVMAEEVAKEVARQVAKVVALEVAREVAKEVGKELAKQLAQTHSPKLIESVESTPTKSQQQ